MDPKEHATYTVTGCEVSVIPGSEYVCVHIVYAERSQQRKPTRRRYVFSFGQLAELRDAIDEALRVLKQSLKRDPPPPIVH
jgi:hypothetical protein